MADCESLINSSNLPKEIREELMNAVEQGDKELFDDIVKRSAKEQVVRQARLKNSAEVRARLEKYHDGRTDTKAALQDELSGRGLKTQGKGTSMDTDIKAARSRLETVGGDFLDAVNPKFFKGQAAGRLVRATMKAYYEGRRGLSKGAEGVQKQAELAAKALQDADDLMYKMLDEAGLDVSYIPDYGVPLKHDAAKIKKMGEAAWVQLVKDVGMAGKIIPTPTQVSKGITQDKILESMYKNIISQGALPDDQMLRKVLGPDYRKGFMKERVLQPTDGDGVIAYMKAAGASDTVYDGMTRKFDMVAREYAAVKRFGLDYEDNFNWLANRTDVKLDSKKVSITARHMFDRLINKPLGYEPMLVSKLLGDVRSLMVIAKLPFTAITATSDVSFTNVTKLFSGYKPFVRMQRTLSRINPTKPGAKEMARKLGLIIDDSMRYLASETDWKNMSAHKFFKNMANLSTQISMLTPWTNMMKRNAGLDTLGSMATNKLRGAWGRTMARYGITKEEYSIMQQAITTIEGVKFVDVNLDIIPDDLKMKVMSTVFSEMSLMVPEMSTKAASWMSGRSERGRGKEAFISTLTQFQGFSASQLTTHWVRVMDSVAQGGSQAMYGPVLFFSSISMGHASISMAQIAMGNDPKKLVDQDGSVNWSYVLECVNKTGLAPVIGDYFMTDPTLYGGTEKKLLGPGIGMGVDAFKLAFAPLWQLKDEPGTLAEKFWGTLEKYYASRGRVLSFAERNTFFNRLPYTRAAWDHTLGKALHQLVDDRYFDKQTQLNQRMADEGRGRFIEEQRMPDINPFK